MQVRAVISYNFSDDERKKINSLLFSRNQMGLLAKVKADIDGPGLASHETLTELIHQLGNPAIFRDDSDATFICNTKRLTGTTWNELLDKERDSH
jgi:hypothetical protein